MMGAGRAIRTYVFPVLVSIAAPIYAIWFSLSPRVVDGPALEDPPIGWYIEVTVDHLQPIPWTIKNERGWITGRFLVGWIGGRALLVQADPEVPSSLQLRGELHRLTGEPRTWVDQSPQLAGVSYNAVLDVSKPGQRTALAVGGLLVSIGMLGFWLYRLYRWRRPARLGASKPKFGSRLDAERPRSDALVAAALWRHGTLRPALWFIVYAIFVMPVPALLVADYLHAADARFFAPFALGLALTAPVSGLPFFWWMRRRRGEISRVVRHGEMITGAIVSATAWGTRGMFGLSRFNASHTNVGVAVSLGGVPRYYRVQVQGSPGWVAPGAAVRVLASSEERFAIVIAPTGQDCAARAVRSSARGGKVDKLPAARVVKVSSRGEPQAAVGAAVAAEVNVTAVNSGDSTPSA